jgi:RNA recognition motif-containing protein
MPVVENRVFVNGVPQSAMKDELAVHFGQFGETIDVYMPMQFGGGQHKGMCFVTYQFVEAVELALHHPGGHFIQGTQVTCEACLTKDKGGGKGGKAMPGSVMTGDRLFISKIPPDATREEVEALFSRFGQWTDVFLPNGNFPAGHKGICFISYSDQQAAQLAIQCGPHQLRGQDLVCELATPREPSKGKGKGKDKDNGKDKHMQFQVQHQPAYQPAYQPAWQPMEQPVSHYYQPQQQQTAPRGMVVPPPPQFPAGGHYKGAHQPVAPTVGLKPGRLFLTKVADDVTKEDLTLYFQQYGEIQDVFVPNGKSIAFVSFSDPNMAAVVTQTHEHEVKIGRLVTVDLAYDRPPIESKGKGKFRYQPYN